MDLDLAAAAALATLDDATRRGFVNDPLAALTGLGLAVEAVTHLDEARDGGGACDGASYVHDEVILYRPSPYSRRQNFTLGHELGHHLVDGNASIVDWLADQPDPMQQLETICDRVAQALLLPDAVVAAHLGRPVRARSVLDLYEHTQASRPACAIAVAQRLPGLGAVVIFEPDTNNLGFTSVHPDPDRGWPEVFPWKGHPLPAGHPLKTLTPGGTLTQRTFWETPWGRRERFYVDAIADNRRVIAVFSDSDLWDCEKLHIEPPRAYADRPLRDVTCCGVTRQVRGYPCATCDGGYCPTCGNCRCQKNAEREQQCQGCYQVFLPHLLIDRRCEECR